MELFRLEKTMGSNQSFQGHHSATSPGATFEIPAGMVTLPLPGQPGQGLTTLLMEKFFPIPNLNLAGTI